MRLKELLSGVDTEAVQGDLDVEVRNVDYDSRAVGPGSVFVAIRGLETDGNRFVDQAAAAGAVAIVSENPPVSAAAARIEVVSDRLALAQLASTFFRRPTAGLTLVGITGTNGKTTTAHLVDAMLAFGDVPVALAGTIDYRIPGRRVSAVRTTPEAPDLERFFREAVDAGCRCAVMEVSSHALVMRRVEALVFDVVVFTNLSGDHLDFHGSMRDYFQAKQRLFGHLEGPRPKVAVLNRDDPWFGELGASTPMDVITFGMSPDADVYPTSMELGDQGIAVDFQSPAGKISLKSGLLGRTNAYNIAAAVGVGVALDLDPSVIAAGIGQLKGVPGRLEPVDCGQSFRVLVDYAHTDDALARVLEAAREITPGRLIVVFGAGGDRDQSKRARMGEVAAKGSDVVIVTSDNPRSEDPLGIIHMVEVGIRRALASPDNTAASGPGRGYEAIPDRRDAIGHAIAIATGGDTVLIAGKGHETTQVVGSKTYPFDDRAVAREFLEL